MRFEIRAGGAFLILIGLLGLSAAVFALGLVAGYEMARQNTPDTSQLASTFPAPSPPALAPSPSASAARSVIFPSAAASVATIAPPVHPKPPVPAAMTSATAARASAASPHTVANAAPSPAIRRRPYNIQIDAVMDRAGADDMVRRLRALGFPSTESTTVLNGQTWYRVSVGPYATEDDARAAQEKLRQQYRATYRGN